jgi:hypothetical protein
VGPLEVMSVDAEDYNDSSDARVQPQNAAVDDAFVHMAMDTRGGRTAVHCAKLCEPRRADAGGSVGQCRALD